MKFNDLDPQLVAPKRFVTLAHLNLVEQADYPGIQEATGLSTSDLSRIIRDFEERGLVEVSKERKDRYGVTLVRLSPLGRKTFTSMVATLNRIAGTQ